jgi:hypothetical protein
VLGFTVLGIAVGASLAFILMSFSLAAELTVGFWQAARAPDLPSGPGRRLHVLDPRSVPPLDVEAITGLRPTPDPETERETKTEGVHPLDRP